MSIAMNRLRLVRSFATHAVPRPAIEPRPLRDPLRLEDSLDVENFPGSRVIFFPTAKKNEEIKFTPKLFAETTKRLYSYRRNNAVQVAMVHAKEGKFPQPVLKDMEDTPEKRKYIEALVRLWGSTWRLHTEPAEFKTKTLAIMNGVVKDEVFSFCQALHVSNLT